MNELAEINPDAIYLGCYRTPGHFIFLAGMQKAPYPQAREWAKSLDSDKYPGFYEEGGRRLYLPQGKARVEHKRGWTFLSWWDYSIDDRPGSHCVFVLKGTMEFERALEVAKEKFAPVFERLSYEVTEWDEDKSVVAVDKNV